MKKQSLTLICLLILTIHAITIQCMEEKKITQQTVPFLKALAYIKKRPSYEQQDEYSATVTNAGTAYLMDYFPDELQVAISAGIEIDARYLASCNPVHLIQIHAQGPTVTYDSTTKCATLGCKATNSCSHTKQFRNVSYVKASDAPFSSETRQTWKKLYDLTQYIDDLSNPDFMIFEGEIIRLSGHGKKICEWLMHPQERLQRLNTFKKACNLYNSLLIHHRCQAKASSIQTSLPEKQRGDLEILEECIANLENKKEPHEE